MYKAPKFVKVELNVEESFTTYTCEYMTDGRSGWVFVGDNCTEYEIESGTDVSGSVARFAPYECWISPSV